MGITVSVFLAIIASLVTIASGTMILIRNLRDRSKRDPIVISGTVIVVILIIIVAIGLTRVIPLTINGTSTISLGLGNSTTPLNTPVSANTTVPKLGDGSVTLNKEVTCNACDAPFKVVLQNATINNNQGNTILSFQLTNRAGTETSVAIVSITLNDNSEHKYVGTGTWQSSGTSFSDTPSMIAPGKSDIASVNFSFIPNVNTSYQLHFENESYDANIAHQYVPLTYDILAFDFNN